uniref:Uncharacterized protein n=1 Tax=Anguilla anguilla TaxID=7936 RepID=A0A0E9X4T9_ANGAN
MKTMDSIQFHFNTSFPNRFFQTTCKLYKSWEPLDSLLS